MERWTAQDLADFARSPEAGTGAVLLDVRESWEFDQAAIRLAELAIVHMPMGSVPQRVNELDAGHKIVCVCHHGMRSAHVAAYLEQTGFTSVVNLEGGIDAWSQQIDPAVPRY